MLKVGGVPVGSISSSTGSGEVDDGISGEPECDARRSALLWMGASADGGTDVVDVEVSQVMGGIVCAERLSCAASAAAESGEVAELWAFSEAVR